jgi:NAD(P)-dependent dehydrogenase (short-subunit alcohol dehydrogenase family)
VSTPPAKFGIIGLTQVAAQEFAPFVTVNAVGPGDVATDTEATPF